MVLKFDFSFGFNWLGFDMDNNYNDTRYLDLMNKEQGASALQQYRNLVLEKKEASICSLVGCISFSHF